MAFCCGLLLCHAPSTARAAGKPAAPRTAKTVVRKPAPVALPVSDFGPADILDDAGPGRHGLASFYGKGFHGRRTSTGERFDARQFTGASNHFPLGTLVAVRRVDNDRCAVVRINDRMHARHRRRVIDVSLATAEYLGMLRAGVVFVRVAPLKADGACQAAFEPDLPCLSCGDTPNRLPGILSGSHD
ncbi:MAG: septal ring lytic transglycosylase RlpA family protein [Azonexus sp.]